MMCGRTIEWRKKWARNWEQVRYCSDRCRLHKPNDTDRALEAAILALLTVSGRGKTICPSDAARKVAPQDWQPLMERARAAARRLVSANEIVITQGGQVIEPSRAHGPIRLRLP